MLIQSKTSIIGVEQCKTHLKLKVLRSVRVPSRRRWQSMTVLPPSVISFGLKQKQMKMFWLLSGRRKTPC